LQNLSPHINEILKITNENSRAFQQEKPQKVQAVALIPKMYLVAVLMVIRVDSWAKATFTHYIIFMMEKNTDKKFVTILKFSLRITFNCSI
jgi:hypothetical protein